MSPRPAKRLTHAEMRAAITARVAIDANGCWIWRGAKQRGYGCFQWGGRGAPMQRVHRAAWEAWKNAAVGHLHVLHRCDVKACCNPDHLFLGSHADNMDDMQRKGRAGFKRQNGSTNPNAKIIEETAIEIYRAQGRNVDIARRFSVSPTVVSEIKRGVRWTHVTGPHQQCVPA